MPLHAVGGTDAQMDGQTDGGKWFAVLGAWLACRPSLMSYPACPRTPIVYWADPIGSDIQIRLPFFFFFFVDIVIVTHILVQLLDAWMTPHGIRGIKWEALLAFVNNWHSPPDLHGEGYISLYILRVSVGLRRS